MVYKAGVCDIAEIAEMAKIIWKSSSYSELTGLFKENIDSERSAVFIAKEDGKTVGFAQCSLKFDYVEGTSYSPVGYLEGVYVKPEYRHRGLAKELLKSCENWAKEKGSSEFASDCELDNSESIAFHLEVGFSEANRIICFTKKL